MGLIKIKAKVKLISEEDLEWDEESMGKVYKNPEFEWKYKVMDTYYIAELTELTKNKTILERIDGSLLLVAESIDSLYNKWIESKEEDLILGDNDEEEFEENENKEEEEND